MLTGFYEFALHHVTCAVIFSCIGLCLLILLGLILLKKLRHPETIEVNCWFCSAKTTVPFGNKDCWDCPHCDQYNGFDDVGDYNKPIPAQYEENLNNPVKCQKTEYLSSPSILCQDCRHRLTLKIRQVADFVPLNEDDFYKEAELYEKKLEQLYELCNRCKHAVQSELAFQDEILQAKLTDCKQSVGKKCEEKDVAEPDKKDPADAGTLILILTVLSAGCAWMPKMMLITTTCRIHHYNFVSNQIVPGFGFLSFVGLGSFFLLKLYAHKFVCNTISSISCKLETKKFKARKMETSNEKLTESLLVPDEKGDILNGMTSALQLCMIGGKMKSKGNQGIYGSPTFSSGNISSSSSGISLDTSNSFCSSKGQRKPLISPAKLTNIFQTSDHGLPKQQTDSQWVNQVASGLTMNGYTSPFFPMSRSHSSASLCNRSCTSSQSNLFRVHRPLGVSSCINIPPARNKGNHQWSDVLPCDSGLNNGGTNFMADDMDEEWDSVSSAEAVGEPTGKIDRKNASRGWNISRWNSVLIGIVSFIFGASITANMILGFMAFGYTQKNSNV